MLPHVAARHRLVQIIIDQIAHPVTARGQSRYRPEQIAVRCVSCPSSTHALLTEQTFDRGDVLLGALRSTDG